MEAVFGFVPYATLRAVDHLGGDFLASVRGEAVKEDRVRFGPLHEAGVDRVAGKRLLALGLLLLLPHRSPDIGVDHRRAVHRLARIADDEHFRLATCARDQLRLRIVAFRAGDGERETETVRGVDPRVRHVVAIPDPGDAASIPPAKVLPHREQIGEHLAGVQQIRQPVDHRHRGVTSELDDLVVRKGADHDPIHVARQHAGGIRDRLTTPELNVARREKERVPAELPRADLERHARPGGGFHEDHPQRLTRERLPVVPPAPHAVGEIEQVIELVAGEVRDGEEVAKRHCVWSVVGGQ